MSSFYKGTVVASNSRLHSIREIPKNANLEKLEISTTSEVREYGYELNLYSVSKTMVNNDKRYTMIKCGSHSCRETLLNGFQLVLSQLNGNPYLQDEKVFVEYFKEGDKNLSEERIGKILEFGERFLDSGKNKDSFSVIDSDKEGVVLYLTVDRSRFMTELYMLSMILWIFRNEKILDDVLKKFPKGRSNLQDLFYYMSVRFLEEKSWGDLHNQNIYMSLFCHYASRGELFSGGNKWALNGPQNAGRLAVPVSGILEYIEEVYVNSGYGLDFKSIPNNTIKESDFISVASLFLENKRDD